LGSTIIENKVLLKWIFEKWDGDMDWIDLNQDRDRWRAFVEAVMHIGVSKMRELF
jgi:hypothetical protein